MNSSVRRTIVPAVVIVMVSMCRLPQVKAQEVQPRLTLIKNVDILDGGGRTLMPGLIDSHVHFNVVIEGGLKEIEAAR